MKITTKLFIVTFSGLVLLAWGLSMDMALAKRTTCLININRSFAAWRASSMDEKVLKSKLSPEQYRVLRENTTERPFDNSYWDNKRPGIYVDPITGKVLFASLDKFDSGTGWPSFTKPVIAGEITEKKDTSLGMTRTEVRSASSDSHLGHVFEDGPQPTGLRYCINSAALRFIPLEDLEQEGYGQYRSLFAQGGAGLHQKP